MNGLGLFAGAAGLELGLRLALGNSYRAVCHVEIEAYAIAHLVARMEAGQLDQAPIWDDISTFDGNPWRGIVDIVSGGFPCQDISDAGLRKGIIAGKRSALWFEMVRVIRETEPEWVFVENVDSLVVRGLDFVLWSLADLGFSAEWGVLGADDAGAPHYRKRTFILGHADSRNRRPCWSPVAKRASAGLLEHASWQGVGQANALLERWGEGWPESARIEGRPEAHVGSDPVSQDVADSDTTGCSGVGSGELFDGLGQAYRDDADGRECPSASMDYSDSGRRGRQDYDVRPGRDRPGRTGNAVMGDPERQSLALGVCLCRNDGTQCTTAERAGSLWPYGRDYSGEWPAGLEPALCRVADGMAPWVDRLRLTGNGVVPVVAAMAFLALRERLVAA